MRARVPVERALELGLEEQVAGLPPRDRRLSGVERHQRLAVGPEPVVLPQRDHLAGEPVGEAERLQQPHDLVVDVDRPRQPVDLVVALEYGDLVTGAAAEQRRERLADGAVAHDRHVDLGLHGSAARRRRRRSVGRGSGSARPQAPRGAGRRRRRCASRRSGRADQDRSVARDPAAAQPMQRGSYRSPSTWPIRTASIGTPASAASCSAASHHAARPRRR